MNKQTVYIDCYGKDATHFIGTTIPSHPVKKIESVYVLTEQELEEIILKAWKQSRDGIAPTQTVYNIFNQKINKQP